MQYFFQFYFVFVFCEIVQVKYGILQEHATGETVTSSYIEPSAQLRIALVLKSPSGLALTAKTENMCLCFQSCALIIPLI